VRHSFTMLELIFVIVVLGILAAVAVPKLWVTRNDAEIAKLRSDITNIRAAISTKYSKNILEGNVSCPDLETGGSDVFFEGVLTYPIKQNSGGIHWSNSDKNYTATVNGKNVKFYYYDDTTQNCKFECYENCDVIGE